MNCSNGVLLAAVLFAATTASAAQPIAADVSRTDLQRHDLSIVGRETVQARIDIAPGAVAPWHRHPGEEVIYVIEGTLEYQLEGQQPVTVKAGEVLFVPAGVAHTARNPGPTTAPNSRPTSSKKASRCSCRPQRLPSPDLAKP